MSIRAWFKGLLSLSFLLVVLAAAGQEVQTRAHVPKRSVTLQHLPKLSDKLLALAGPATATTTSWPNRTGPQVFRGRVRAVIEPLGPSSRSITTATLNALGITIEARSKRLLRVLVPPGQLVSLARLPSVAYVRPPHRYWTEDFPTSQALTPVGATLLQRFDVQGQGVKVAIIDVGFGSLDYAKRKGALPEDVVADFTDYGGQGAAQGNHGTAVALIVHEMAPKATLYLKQIADEVDLENAVDDAIRQGVSIINHSVGWTNSNFSDGRGFFAELAQRAQDAGILWVNAAGNHAQNHWTGRFVDQDDNRWSDFPGSPEQALRVPAYFGSLISVSLTWDDWPRSAQDFDLYLYDSEGDVVAASDNRQTGFEPPVESLDFFVEKTDVYRIRVLARSVYKPQRIKIFTDAAHPLNPNTPHGSLLAPADARSVLAVGAMSIRNWPEGPQQPYSSLGPTSDGRIKPDISGPDDVRNLLFHPFAGTSAAAPHVAGAAALLLGQHPDWDVFQLRNALEARALDLGLPGKDPTYGAGALDLASTPLGATRELSVQRVQPGQSLEVTLSAQLPALVFGTVELAERLPQGWTLSSQDEAFDPQTQRWRWDTLPQGAVVKAHYTLSVPTHQAPGLYTLSGRINGFEIAGQDVVEVFKTSKVLPKVRLANPDLLRLYRLNQQVIVERKKADGRLTLAIYDLGGVRVYEAHTTGFSLRWNGLGLGGNTAANGLYYAVVSVEDEATNTQRRVFPIVWLR